MESPFEAQMGMPMGMPMEAQMGMPMGMPMGSPLEAQMGMQMGMPMGMPMGGHMGIGQPQPLDFSQAYVQSAGPGMPMHPGAVLPAFGYPCPPFMIQPAYAPMVYGVPSPNFGDCGCGGNQVSLNESFTLNDDKIDIRNEGDEGAKVSSTKGKKGKSAKAVVKAFVSKKQSAPKQKRRTKLSPWINI
jgi:hypothetical protein